VRSLYFITGLSGSGKTTLLRAVADALSVEVIDTTSADPATSARALAASITGFAASLR